MITYDISDYSVKRLARLRPYIKFVPPYIQKIYMTITLNVDRVYGCHTSFSVLPRVRVEKIVLNLDVATNLEKPKTKELYLRIERMNIHNANMITDYATKLHNSE